MVIYFKCNKLWRVKKQKQKAGKLYDANNDIELVSERKLAKEVCYELNSLRPSQRSERENIIRRLFGKTGKSFLIDNHFIVITDIISK